VGLVAPSLFSGFFELPIGLALCAALTAAVLIAELRKRALAFALAAAVVGYAIVLGIVIRDSVKGYRVVTRNFYGQLRVSQVDDDDGMGMRRKLMHGGIIHGAQFLNPPYRSKPNSYYCTETGLGRAMTSKEGVPRRIGVLGLGTGTIAAFGRAGDTIRIYEINPTVVQLARNEFSYLRDTKARVEIVMGDGRLSLEREPDQRFDILVMDAFSGDSVPVHLLTEEAFRTYLRHLAPGGVLAVNISNVYLGLSPVIERAASRFGKTAINMDFEEADDDYLCYAASWVLVVDRGTHEPLRTGVGTTVLKPKPGFRLWTDDYSSLHSVLK
jgi:SAM-dependent methyltransferase